MKNVLLLGDSIRLGYGKYVRMAFDGQAQVFFPEDNCRFAAYLLRHLIEWNETYSCETDMDVIHWNAGLWDALNLADGEALTPIDHYTYYLERIHRYLKQLYPNAVQIFATSTKVIEPRFQGQYKRFNKEIQRYNAAAAETLAPLGVTINDLYGLTDTFPESHWSDMTHFNTKEGAEALTSQVCRHLGEVLNITPTLPDFDKLFQKETNIIGL